MFFFIYKRRRSITIFSRVGAYNISIDEGEGQCRPNIFLSYHENSHYNSVHHRFDEYGCRNKTKSSNETLKASTNKKKRGNKIKHVDKDCNDNVENLEPEMKNDSTPEQVLIVNNGDGEEVNKIQVMKKNDTCTCGSGLRYKKCCLAKQKNKVRLEKFRGKHGLIVNESYDREDRPIDSATELEGGFAILNI